MKDEHAFFSLLRTAIWGAERCPLPAMPETDWDKVYKELTDQSVTALCVDAALSVPELAPQLRTNWLGMVTRNVAFWHKLMREQDRLYSLMEQAGIPMVILKGAAACMYYPKPEYRAMGDIDVIVKPEDFERAASLLEENGCCRMEHETKQHIEFRSNGVLIELHRKFATMQDAAAAEMLDRRIFAAIEDRQELTMDGYRAPVLPRLENGLVLLAHIDHHMQSGLGLRQFIDWMLFVDRELDDVWWNSEFCGWTKRLGLYDLAVTATRMCQRYLGLREDGITWCMGADAALCDALMNMTMERGNFGRKMPNSQKTKLVVGRMTGVRDTFRMLQQAGLENWKPAEKQPFLRPFAWIYQICRYIKKGFQRKSPIRNLLKDIRQNRKEREIYDRLGVARRKPKKK